MKGEGTGDPSTSRVASVSTLAFVAVLVVATLARAAAFGSLGTPDVLDFVVWTHEGATRGVTSVYGVGRSESRELVFAGQSSSPDYPPVALYELSAAGRLFRSFGGDLESVDDLRLLVKVLATLGDAVVTALIFWGVNRRWGSGAAKFSALVYWANPAVILHSSVLGYVGSLAAAPAVAALVVADAGWGAASGAFVAFAGLTKPQGLFVAPGVAVALLQRCSSGRLSNSRLPLRGSLNAAFIGGTVMSAIVALPFLVRGTFDNMFMAVAGLLNDGTLSAWAANVWWMVGYAKAGVPLALIIEVADVLDVRSAPRLVGALILSGIGWAIVITVVAWAVRGAVRVGRRTDDDAQGFAVPVALAALTTHTYFMFATHVHENHMWDVLPLFAILSAGRRADRALLALLSAIVFLNLNIFYGFGENVGFALPRSITFIDASVVLAAVNIAAWVWHVRLFAVRVRPSA